MRKIELKIVSEDPTTSPIQQDTFDYRKEIEAILRGPSQQGISYEDLEYLEQIRDALAATPEDSGQPIYLEEATWQYLVKRLKATKWLHWREPMKQFIDDIANSPKATSKPQPPTEPTPTGPAVESPPSE